jgi:hypothetical protein
MKTNIEFERVPFDYVREYLDKIIRNIDKGFIHIRNDLWIKEIPNEYFQFYEIDLYKNATVLYSRWGIGFYKIPIFLDNDKAIELDYGKSDRKYHHYELSKYDMLGEKNYQNLKDGKSYISISNGKKHFEIYTKKYFNKNKKQIINFYSRTNNYINALKERIKYLERWETDDVLEYKYLKIELEKYGI